MNILITGSTGFVGLHLSNLLHQKNHQLFLLARNPEKLPDQSPVNLRQFVIKGDLSKQSIHSWIEKLPTQIDCVIHVAGVVHSFDIEKFYKTNSDCTKDLVQALKERYEHLHFILISSLAAAGATINRLRNENDQCLPVSHYGKSKLKAEKNLFDFKGEHWTYNIIRPPIVMGPDDPAMLDVFKMVKGGVVPLAGLGALNYKYSFVCVFDLISAIANLVNKKQINQIYFIAHPQVVTMKEILKEIALKIKPKFQIYLSLPIFILKYLSYLLFVLDKLHITSQRITPDKIFELKVKNWSCDNSKSLEHNFAYQWDLSKTVEITYNNYREEDKL